MTKLLGTFEIQCVFNVCISLRFVIKYKSVIMSPFIEFSFHPIVNVFQDFSCVKSNTDLNSIVINRFGLNTLA